ncbi:MAG: hypothetical protein FWF79_01465, partial [Defluviitaleaceae bacterium]|nr:hypothetical protein [Defluviitaleaceae bacterium]
NNLNQVARRLNESNSFGEKSITVMNECWKAYRAINALEGVVLNAIVQRKGEQGNSGESD